MKTPVDTGRARGNWQTTIGKPATGNVDAEDKGGGATIAKVAGAVQGWDGMGDAFLSNNLPYINRLENGYSGQAPSGMVRVTMTEFSGVVRDLRR